MKIRISFFIVILIAVLMTTFLYFAEALRSRGRDCYGTFSGNIFQDSSDDKIIEKFEWTNTHTLNPRVVSVGYEDAKIFGKIRAYQDTFGRGLVGVLSIGSVSGPDFSMNLPKEFNIRSVSVISGTWDTTSMSSHQTSMTDEPGTYTVTGSAEIMAVKGKGGITVMGTGLSGSGSIQFHVTETADPVTHTLTVKQKKPKSYECSHANCTVELPHKHHHRTTCQEKRYLGNTQIKITCGQKYHLCQTTTCPLDGLHVIPYVCGHEDIKDNASTHQLQANCPVSITQDGSTVYCTRTGFFACLSHKHVFPSSGSGSPNNGGGQNNNNGGVGEDTNQNVDPGNGGVPSSNGGCNTPEANGGCTTTSTLVNCDKRYEYSCYVKVSNSYEHLVNCPGCYEGYWTCNSSDVAEHGLRSCTRPVQTFGSPCNNQWRRCAHNPYTPNGGIEYFDTAPRCSTSTRYLECSGPVLP